MEIIIELIIMVGVMALLGLVFAILKKMNPKDIKQPKEDKEWKGYLKEKYHKVVNKKLPDQVISPSKQNEIKQMQNELDETYAIENHLD